MKPSQETVDNWKEIFSKRPKDALPPVYEDLEFLYDYVTEKNPVIILEFGSGCSTLVMANALTDNAFGHIISFDNSREWLWETIKMFNESSFTRNYYKLHFAMTHKYIFYDDTPVFSYFYHEVYLYPDLIYLDGPELTEALATADPLFYEHKMRPGANIIVDGREESVEFLKKNLLRKWKFRHEDIGDNGMSIFELEG